MKVAFKRLSAAFKILCKGTPPPPLPVVTLTGGFFKKLATDSNDQNWVVACGLVQDIYVSMGVSSFNPAGARIAVEKAFKLVNLLRVHADMAVGASLFPQRDRSRLNRE